MKVIVGSFDAGSIWRHKVSGSKYELLGPVSVMISKHNWRKMLVYRAITDNFTCARSELSFMKEFEFVEKT